VDYPITLRDCFEALLKAVKVGHAEPRRPPMLPRAHLVALGVDSGADGQSSDAQRSGKWAPQGSARSGTVLGPRSVCPLAHCNLLDVPWDLVMELCYRRLGPPCAGKYLGRLHPPRRGRVGLEFKAGSEKTRLGPRFLSGPATGISAMFEQRGAWHVPARPPDTPTGNADTPSLVGGRAGRGGDWFGWLRVRGMRGRISGGWGGDVRVVMIWGAGQVE
jgi:hypothetical protein